MQDNNEEGYHDRSLDDFATYEDYLDNFIDDNDMKYLGNIELARQLIELGIHSKVQILKKEQFEAKKKAIAESIKNQNTDKVKELSHKLVKDPSYYMQDEFLRELAKREDEVINGKLMVIIFIRAVKRKPKVTSDFKKVKEVESKYDKHDIRYLKKQQNKELEEERKLKEAVKDSEELQLKEMSEEGIEISGYIDFAHRLKTEDFRQYFEGQKLFLPKNTDLSYYNWNTSVCVSNDSPNFKVDASSGSKGLLFRNKRDRKVINVDPGTGKSGAEGSETTMRYTFTSQRPEYKQIVIFDHYTRRKT